MQQVAVRGVNLDRPETRGCGPLRRFPEAPNDSVQILRGHPRGRPVWAERARWAQWRTAQAPPRHPPCARRAPVEWRGPRRCQPMTAQRDQGLGLAVVPQPQVLRADPATRLDRGRLDDDQACATDGSTAQVHEVPISGNPIFFADRVLAHRGNPQPVAGRNRTELQGCEDVSVICHRSFLWSICIWSGVVFRPIGAFDRVQVVPDDDQDTLTQSGG